MDLLSLGDWAEIHSAFKDVTDTFFKEESIVWNRYIRPLDQFGESKAGFTAVPLKGYVELDTNDSDNVTMVDGKTVNTSIKVSFYFQYLQGLGYVTNGKALFDGANDHFIVHGEKYNITSIEHDGLTPPPEGYVLVYVYLLYDNKQ